MTNEQDNLRIKHQKAHMYYKLCLAKRDKLINYYKSNMMR